MRIIIYGTNFERRKNETSKAAYGHFLLTYVKWRCHVLNISTFTAQLDRAI